MVREHVFHVRVRRARLIRAAMAIPCEEIFVIVHRTRVALNSREVTVLTSTVNLLVEGSVFQPLCSIGN